MLGERLRQLRKERGLTQAQLAAILVSGESTISQWENGRRQIDIETVERLASFFGVSVDYLLGRSNVRGPLPSPDLLPDIELDRLLEIYEVSVRGQRLTRSEKVAVLQAVQTLVQLARGSQDETPHDKSRRHDKEFRDNP